MPAIRSWKPRGAAIEDSVISSRPLVGTPWRAIRADRAV